MKKILITGGAGYIGSKLATYLLSKNYKVTVLDSQKYTKDSLNHLFSNKNFTFLKCDVRNIKILSKFIKQNDIIIPLAALVGAPLCEKNKKETIQTNLNSIKNICNILDKKIIIYLNRNSGYGIGLKNKYCDENSKLNPISLYGRTKCDAEKYILKSKNYICLRLATVFGYSYRMRTDLLVNDFTLKIMKEKKIELFEAHFRRNFININDVVQAIDFNIKNFKKMRNNIYNLGLSSANLTKLQLANKIKKVTKSKCIISASSKKKDPDQRDYFVSNKKIEKMGFKAKYSLESGIKELQNVYKNLNRKVVNNY